MKEASKLEMKYDSILIRIKGFRGYESERIKKIGWGSYIQENERNRFNSPFKTEVDSRPVKYAKKHGFHEYL
jgi:hypothetical protein